MDTDSPAETWLRCPGCDYDLTGLSENRCPECGTEFDPARVARLCSPAPLAATPWEEFPGWSGFWKTWALAVTRPEVLARDFPGRHHADYAVLYSAFCYLAAFLTLTATVATVVLIDEREPEACGIILALAMIGLVSAYACELLLAALFTRLARPACTPAPYRFWRGVVHYSSGFLFFSAATLSLAVLPRMFRPVAILLLVIPFVWWWYSVGTFLTARARPGASRTIAIVLIPVIGVFSVCLAYAGLGIVVWAVGF